MTNYNDGNWYGWNGGECPVHPETVVEAVLYDKTYAGRPMDPYNDSEKGAPAKELEGCWEHRVGLRHVIAFRVIKEHKEPRELWMRRTSVLGHWLHCDESSGGAVLFREVLE